MMDENNIDAQRAMVDARQRNLVGSITPAGTFTRALPVLLDPRDLEGTRRPLWQFALWCVCYVGVLALASYLSTLAWAWSPYAGGAAWATTMQLALLPWRR